MRLMTVDPRALKENPDRARQTKSNTQADALMLATIKAVGIVQPPLIAPETGGGNGYIIDAGHRRVRLAIAAGLEEIEVLVADAANDNGAMRSMVENIAREPLNPVDQWRAIERLVALGWTEEAIGVALGFPVRQIRKLRLLANVLSVMLDQMAKGDMPDERQLRTIAAASPDEQAEVWKKHKPKKGDPQVSWWSVAQALTKTRMLAKDASFDDELAKAYGIVWHEDLFAPANEDSRYTTDTEAFLGAQNEWMANNLPKRGVLAETTQWGEVKLPLKAERIYGKPGKADHSAWYLDRDGKVQSVAYRMPEQKKPKAKTGTATGDEGTATDEASATTKPRPDVTQNGRAMIGDFRTDALHEALAHAPIEDDTLMALLVLAFAGSNVSIASRACDNPYGHARLERHAVRLIGEDGKLSFDPETLSQVVRSVLIDVFSARENRSDSGIVARVSGDAIGADSFLPNMGTEDFLSCLSRSALEASCRDTPVLPRARVRETRSALVEHFKEGRLVHPAALFAPANDVVAAWVAKHAAPHADEYEVPGGGPDGSATDVGEDDAGLGADGEDDEAAEDGDTAEDGEGENPYAVAAE